MNDFNKSYIGLRTDLIKLIEGKSKNVLDVGCATGVNGKYLLDSKMASVVYGVEFEKSMSKTASLIYNKVYCGDLNDENFRKYILKESPVFDYIIFGDILEHLYEPDKVLAELKEKLNKSGKIIISLPNIAHIELFIQVYLKKKWPRNDRGIFDKTHIRWFTKNDSFEMIENCNLKVVHYQRKLRARDAKGSKFDWKYKLLRFLNKDLVTFQHIIVCTYA